MKPKTKLQRQVAALSKKVPAITLKQKQWAYKQCLPHLGYANKSTAFCLDCGKSFDLELIYNNRAVCPNCGTRISIQETRKTTYKHMVYFAITYIIEDFQVVANYELIANYKKGKKVDHYLHEILEYWIQPGGKYTKIGRLHNFNWLCDAWTGDWSIRMERMSYGGYMGKYKVYPAKYHPDSKFKPEYKKIGINGHLYNLDMIEAIDIIPKYPKAETLLKARQWSLLGEFANSPGNVSEYWPSIKICLRNNYKVKDASVWMDYIDLLQYFGKDLRNAKYVCPAKLKAEHDRLVIKKSEYEKRHALELRRQSIEKAQKLFAKKIKAFCGLQFTDGVLVVKVLETVKEFELESDILKHCLFANGYYRKQDSLILSARIDDIPIETIEISLSKMKIRQARGLHNNPTKYHKKILSLVNENLPVISKISNKKTA